LECVGVAIGAAGMSVEHRRGHGGRRAPWLQRSEGGGVEVLVCWSRVEPFSLLRLVLAVRDASVCFASVLEWPVVLDSAMEVAILCSMFNVPKAPPCLGDGR